MDGGPIKKPDQAGATADQARLVAKHINPSARSKEIIELLYPPSGVSGGSSITGAAAQAAAVQLQQKRMNQTAGDLAPEGQIRDEGAPAATTAFAASPGTAAYDSASSNAQDAAVKGPPPAQPKQAAIAADLASATTSAGPIIMTTPEASAEAQQALTLMNAYDFKIYGQGLTAGAQAVPLAPPDQKVLYQPPPVDPTVTPISDMTAATVTSSSATPPTAAAAASTTEAAIPMRPLPASGSSVSSSSSNNVVRPEAKIIKPFGPSDTTQQQQQQQYMQPQAPVTGSISSSSTTTSTAPAAAVASSDPDSRIAAALRDEYARKKQIQQMQQHSLQYGSTTAVLPGQQGLRQRHPKSSTTTATKHYRRPGQYSTIPTGTKTQRAKGWMQRTWIRAKDWTVDMLETAAAWVLHVLWMAVVWLGRLLLTPITAVFGPWYQYNRRLKRESRELLGNDVNLDLLQEALGAIPSWLQGVGGATEKLAWLNSLLAQVWPVLDPIVCALVKSSIEPLLDDMKPPFISAMGFQKLTLGEFPVELEGIRVVGGDKQGTAAGQEAESGPGSSRITKQTAAEDDRLEVEVDFHWVGEPNISFFVELAVAGPYTRLVPKVSHLTSRGTLRLGLTRLVDQLPGFGAIMISLARTPQIKFTLDFGPALGGKFTAKPVAAFLDPFLRDTLANLIVWPNRFVVPLLPRNVTGNLDDLALHSVGVLEVEVLSAQHLPKKGGKLSTVDPQVELWTQPQHHVFSKVKKSSRNPNWKGQVLEVLVQEPDSQQLRVVMNDIDMLNIKELLQVNLLKGAANLVRSANPIGRAALPLAGICQKPFERQEIELKMSGSEWAYELGVLDEDDTSTLTLAVTYKPFQELKASSTAPIACKGVLLIDVRQCQDLASADWDSGSSDPYVLLKVAGQKQQTVVLPHSTGPTFNAHFEFFNVQVPDVLRVEVWDRDFLKPDDMIGYVELPVTAILTWTQGGGRGWRDGWWRLRTKKGKFPTDDGKDTIGRIEMKVQYRPYSS